MYPSANLKPGPHRATILCFFSFVTLLGAVGLLLISILVPVRQPTISLHLVPTLLLALVTAMSVSAWRIWSVWTEHRNSDHAFFTVSLELSSIFEKAVEGILILDNEANCIDGNPAAAAILRVQRNQLTGKNLRDFIRKYGDFELKWARFFQQDDHRGLAEMLAGDGNTVFVDFTLATNYLDGRHLLILSDVTKRIKAERALRDSEARFRQMADNIQEIVWKMNADTLELIYVNHAYTAITGYSIDSLYRNRFFCELIHPQDRVRALSRLEDSVSTGLFDEEFRFIHAKGDIHWLWVKAHHANDDRGRWIIGIAQDTTSRRAVEERIAEHLEAKESARAEAEALRKATVALSQNLTMDSVLDTLLQCIGELVPFDRASVLFVEDATHLMVARESNRSEGGRCGFILSASESVYLRKILFECEPVLLSNTDTESNWKDTVPFENARSWMGIPLTIAGTVIGILSLCAYRPAVLTPEHLRLAGTLAVSAAVAIQNARVRERAKIYAAELESRTRELQPASKRSRALRKEPPSLP